MNERVKEGERIRSRGEMYRFPLIYVRARARACVCVCMYIYTCIYTSEEIYIHIFSYYVCIKEHTYTRTLLYTHTRACIVYRLSFYTTDNV